MTTLPAERHEPEPSLLIVDDSPAFLQLLEEMLKQHGFQVRSTLSGELALQAAREQAPDLILLDINMPGMNGYEVCERLKADPNLKAVPVIFISGLDDAIDKVRAFGVGAVDYVTKPFQFSEVAARMRTHLALRRQERQLQESFAQLKELERLRDSLTHMIVHDMRSPLTVIRLAMEMLQAGLPPVPASLEKAIRSADHAADGLLKMITQLLDINRLETGQMPINQKRQDLVQTLRATVESMTSLAGERQVRMDMPATTLAVYDQEIVARVVANLLSNAFKFTPDDGTVKVILERHADHVRVSVTDSGPGIAPEYHRKIFDKFCQAELRHAEIGTGLGLSFCNLAVEAHGGQIGVESAPGCGSTFWFTLPVGAEE